MTPDDPRYAADTGQERANHDREAIVQALERSHALLRKGRELRSRSQDAVERAHEATAYFNQIQTSTAHASDTDGYPATRRSVL